MHFTSDFPVSTQHKALTKRHVFTISRKEQHLYHDEIHLLLVYAISASKDLHIIVSQVAATG